MRTVCSVLAVLLLLGACGGRGGAVDISFRVVAEGAMSSHEGGPAIRVAADPSSRAEIERLVGHALGGDVLIAVFQGRQPTGGYAVRLAGMRRDADTISVGATFVRPSPDALVIQVLTSPFAVAEIARSDVPAGRTRFVLRDERGAEIARAELTSR